jgi:hypothetical protein
VVEEDDEDEDPAALLPASPAVFAARAADLAW